MFTKASILSVFAGLAAAQIHAPVGEPNGNSITRPLNEVVPACKPFTITWTPSTPNTVSVLLLKGPSTNVVKFGPSLAEGIANSGSLVWTPAADLPVTEGPNGYGIQIIDDVNGQYQYSTQFGISKDGSACAVVSSSASASASKDSYPASTPIASSSAKESGYPVKSSSSAVSYSATVTPVYSTGAPQHNSTIIQPTGSMTVPSTLRPSVSKTSSTGLPQQSTNAGAKAGVGMVGVAALFAFML